MKGGRSWAAKILGASDGDCVFERDGRGLSIESVGPGVVVKDVVSSGEG